MVRAARQELTGDFGFTKYHARRLTKALQHNETLLDELMSLHAHILDERAVDTVEARSTLPATTDAAPSALVAGQPKRRPRSLTTSCDDRVVEAMKTSCSGRDDPDKPRSHGHYGGVASGALRSVRIARKRSKSAIEWIVQRRSSAKAAEAEEEPHSDAVSTTSEASGPSPPPPPAQKLLMRMTSAKLKKRRRRAKSEGRESGDQELVVVSDATRKKRWTITHDDHGRRKRQGDSAVASAGAYALQRPPQQPQHHQHEPQWAQLQSELLLARKKREESDEDLRLDALVRRHRELAIEELEWDEEQGIISSGMFGRVYKGKWRGVDCAIKQLKLLPTDGIHIFLFRFAPCSPRFRSF